MKQDSLNEYPLFVAMTRPSMMLGVTLTAFIANLTICICFAVITKEFLITAGLFFIFHVIGIIGCAKDERFFDIYLGQFDLPCLNKKIWGCNSYDPE